MLNHALDIAFAGCIICENITTNAMSLSGDMFPAPEREESSVVDDNEQHHS